MIKVIRRPMLNIVLDVNSGSVHLMDEETTLVLEKHLKQEPLTTVEEQEILNELLLLKDNQTLMTEDNKLLPKEMNKSLKSICLNVAHICNLACPYCFAAGGDYNGEAGLMNLATAKLALDFLLEKSTDRTIVEVDFFGGEPLLNFSLIESIVPYGNQRAEELGKKIKWSMTTNGVLLNEEIQDFLIAHQIGTVISIDGRKEVHDRYRCFKNGCGSYDQVVANLQQFIKKTEDYVARGTYTKHNLDFDQDVLALKELGFKHISMEPVVADGTSPWDLSLDDLNTIKESYNRLGELYTNWERTGEGIDFFHFNVALEGGPCLYKRITSCGAGYEYLAITPDGSLYPCHQLIEDQEYCLGNLLDNTLNEKISLEFQKVTIYSKEKCQDCWAKFHCSGGCHGNNYHFAGSLMTPHSLGCELQKIRLEKAISLQVEKLLTKQQTLKGNDQITKDKIKEALGK